MFTFSMKNGALKFVVTLYNNGYQYAKTGTFMHPTLTDGKWHHVALTSDFNKTTYATITTNLYVVYDTRHLSASEIKSIYDAKQ